MVGNDEIFSTLGLIGLSKNLFPKKGQAKTIFEAKRIEFPYGQTIRIVKHFIML